MTVTLGPHGTLAAIAGLIQGMIDEYDGGARGAFSSLSTPQARDNLAGWMNAMVAAAQEIEDAWKELEHHGYPPGEVSLARMIDRAIDTFLEKVENLTRQRDDLLKPVSQDGWQWAMVEVFGHRSHAGRTREEERFGAKMLRIDVPRKGDPAAHGWETLLYGGSSIFSFVPSDEETVMRANKPREPAYTARLPDYSRGGDEEYG